MKIYVIVKEDEIIRLMVNLDSALKYADASNGRSYTIYVDHDVNTLDELTIKDINNIQEDVEKLTGEVLSIKGWLSRFVR